MNRHRSCVPLVALALTACITSQWQKAGAPPSQWALDEAACHRQAQGVGDSVYRLDQFEGPNSTDPSPQAGEIDAYAAMNANFTECMRQRGYYLAAVRQ